MMHGHVHRKLPIKVIQYRRGLSATVLPNLWPTGSAGEASAINSLRARPCVFRTGGASRYPPPRKSHHRAPTLSLSFPKIISVRSDAAIRTGLAW
jgi:hypothetical protein